MYKKSVLQVESCFIANEARPTEFFWPFSLPSPPSIRRFYILFEKNININLRASLVDLAAIYLMLHKSLFINSPVKILTKWGEGRGCCCSVTKNVIKHGLEICFPKFCRQSSTRSINLHFHPSNLIKLIFRQNKRKVHVRGSLPYSTEVFYPYRTDSRRSVLR